MTLRNAFANLLDRNDSDRLAQILTRIEGKLGFLDPASGALRVQPQSTPNMSVVTTVSALTNQVQTGGFFTNNDQNVQFFLAASQNRARITVV